MLTRSFFLIILRNCGLSAKSSKTLSAKRVFVDSTTKRVSGQQQSSYTPNSATARRNWRRRPHSSCKLDSQCSGDPEEKKKLHYNLLVTGTCFFPLQFLTRASHNFCLILFCVTGYLEFARYLLDYVGS